MWVIKGKYSELIYKTVIKVIYKEIIITNK